MRLNKILACCSLLAASLSASAGVELTFEDQGVAFSTLTSPYKGASFAGGIYTYGAVGAGGLGNFVGQGAGNNVAMTFDDALVDQGDPSVLIINFSAGFSTFFKMLYTTIGSWDGAGVEVYSGLNGEGDLLNSSAFITQSQASCSDPTIACEWGGINIALGKDIAHSIVISAPDQTYYFDNLIFGDLPSGTGGGEVPEPTGGALALAALGALAVTRRRRS